MDSVDKPGLQHRLKRFHHTERVINRRAKLAYQLGYTPMPIHWQPFKRCWHVEDYRLYRVLKLSCPCEWGRDSWHKVCREKNRPTNELANHKSHTCSRCGGNGAYRRIYGNSKIVLTRQEIRAIDRYQQQLAEWHQGDSNYVES